MKVVPIQSQKQFNELVSGPKPVVVNFWAPWCGPSQLIRPVFESLSGELSGLVFGAVDVEDRSFGWEFAQANGVRAMPTFQIFENGDKVAELLGADESKLRTLLNDFCNSS